MKVTVPSIQPTVIGSIPPGIQNLRLYFGLTGQRQRVQRSAPVSSDGPGPELGPPGDPKWLGGH